MKKFYKLLLTSLFIVLLWRLSLGIFLTITNPVINAQFPYYESDLVKRYSESSRVWAFFDGIHYLRIASYGYRDLGTQAFFPLYPLTIRLLTPLFQSPLLAGEFISLTCLILALTGLRYLFPTLKHYAISLLLIFPTSFYLASVYTESLFLLLSVWFFVFLKKQWFLPAAALAAIASSTRFAGILLSLSLLYELYRLKYTLPKAFGLMLIAISGLLAYMLYLYRTFGDPLMFIHILPMFGVARSGGEIVLLPQVIWRYLKIFMTVDPTTLIYIRAVFEMLTFSFFSYLLIKFYRLMPVSHLLFALCSYLLPTLSGTLTSFPRYALVIFPFFLPYFSRKALFYLIPSFLLLLYWSFTTFASGYFIS